MRTVVSNSEVTHLWAHKAQRHARSGNGNLYFQDGVIYSYGSHFPIARHATGKDSQAGILFTTEKNSATTSHHITLVRRAIPPDVPVFNVLYMHFGFTEEEDKYQHTRNLARYASEAIEHVDKCARARLATSKEYYHQQAVDLRSEALSYATFFGLPDPDIEPIPDIDSEELERLRAKQAKAAAKKAEATRKENEEKRQHALSLAETWLQGGAHHYLLRIIPTMLRIKDHEIETSMGAKFPILHAKRALTLVKAVMARGEEWRPNGQKCRLGYYHIDRIEANGTVHAGCHVVTWGQIERVAQEVEDYEARIKCGQCQMLSINGMACHETGCPNSNKTWSVEENDWVETEQEVGHETEA
jgi:hypothetical protein